MTIPYNSAYDGTLPFSDTCAQVHLTTNTELTYTIPGTNTKKYVATLRSSPDANIFYSKNVTVTVPAPDTVTTTPTSEQLTFKERRYVSGEDVLHFITPDTDAYLSVALYEIPNP